MPRKFNIAITYAPKIEPVRSGRCRQTIRTLEDRPHKKCFTVGCPRCNFTGTMKAIPKATGDLISFHGWAGRPYHSDWSWRTPYMPITEIVNIFIKPWGIETETEYRNWWALDQLAMRDGIVPATGEELGRVLMGKNTISSTGVRAQIIRW